MGPGMLEKMRIWNKTLEAITELRLTQGVCGCIRDLEGIGDQNRANALVRFLDGKAGGHEVF